MPLNTDEMLNVLSTLAEQRNLRVTLSRSIASGVAVGFAAAVTGIFLGPFGLFAGGTLASLFAAAYNENQFKPLARVILEDMTPIQKEELVTSCKKIIEDLRAEDAVMLLALLANSSSVKEALIKQVVCYTRNNMKLQIID